MSYELLVIGGALPFDGAQDKLRRRVEGSKGS